MDENFLHRDLEMRQKATEDTSNGLKINKTVAEECYINIWHKEDLSSASKEIEILSVNISESFKRAKINFWRLFAAQDFVMLLSNDAHQAQESNESCIRILYFKV
uniref:Uncharacterized protein n=1 Tax=Glossina austeni TaxID=7395 RepID=A0A1A9V822_GLOAU